jgi:hypothetical protein
MKWKESSRVRGKFSELTQAHNRPNGEKDGAVLREQTICGSVALICDVCFSIVLQELIFTACLIHSHETHVIKIIEGCSQKLSCDVLN